MQLTRRRRPPRARDKRISVRKFKGCQIWYPRHQNVSRQRVCYISGYVSIRPSVRMTSRHSFGANARVCKARAGTQFWRQRERMQDARYGTAEADGVGWRADRATHMLAGKELGISEPRRHVSMPPTRHTCFTQQ